MATFRNRTREITLAERARIADTFGTRLVGLLSSKGLADGEALWIEPCNSIHTWFMRFTIDALFLDKNGKVVKAVEQMKPWRLTWIALGARGVLELPAGQIAKTGTKVGDELERREA
jgi:uncharacterized membrane protein (UPF0127 family)